MEMRASRPLAVSQQQAWEALNDPQALKACLAGCEKFEPAEDGGYSVAMAVKVGPVSARFNGRIALSDVLPPESYTIAFEGQGGVAGFGKGQAHVRLAPDPELPDTRHCLLEYEVQAQVGGKIAQLGQRLIDGAARNMADDFFARFDALMQERHPVQDIDDALAAVPADEIEADESDKRSWEYDAANNAATTPLDAAPVMPPHEKSGLPLWTWALALVLVLGVVWLLMK